jgi:hypothetical protein
MNTDAVALLLCQRAAKFGNTHVYTCPVAVTSSFSRARLPPAAMQANYVVVHEPDSLLAFEDAVDAALSAGGGAGSVAIGLDLEGVDLGRKGTIELVTIALSGQPVFIVDVHARVDASPEVRAVKKLISDDRVFSVVHGCQMDCDALHHHFGIRLANVHDTQVFHKQR